MPTESFHDEIQRRFPQLFQAMHNNVYVTHWYYGTDNYPKAQFVSKNNVVWFVERFGDGIQLYRIPTSPHFVATTDAKALEILEREAWCYR